jgi:hypothetical protein
MRLSTASVPKTIRLREMITAPESRSFVDVFICLRARGRRSI